jgi:hypothetical protein
MPAHYEAGLTSSATSGYTSGASNSAGAYYSGGEQNATSTPTARTSVGGSVSGGTMFR